MLHMNIFHQAQQELRESMDQFIVCLRKLATICEYGENKEDEIRGQVVYKFHSP